MHRASWTGMPVLSTGPGFRVSRTCIDNNNGALRDWRATTYALIKIPLEINLDRGERGGGSLHVELMISIDHVARID